MSVRAARGPSGGRLRKTLRWAAWTALAASVLLALAWIQRNRWVAPIVVERISSRLEERSGVRLTVGATSGGWWGDLVVRDLRLGRVDGAWSVAVDFAELEFDLVRLIRGDLGGLRAVRARGVAVEADLNATRARDRDREPRPWPHELPWIEVAGASVRLRLPREGSVELADASLRLGAGTGRFAVAEASLEHAKLGRHRWPASASFTLGDGVLELDELALGDDLRATDGRIDLAKLVRGELEWDATVHGLGGSLQARGGGELDGSLTDVQVNAIDLAQAARFAPTLGPLAGVLDAEVAIVTSRSEGPRVQARGRGRSIAWRGVELDSVATEIAWTPATLEIGKLVAESGRNRVDVEALQVPQHARNWLELAQGARGRIALDLQDMASLLARVQPLELPRHRITLVASLSPIGIDIDSGTIETPSGSLVVRSGRVEWGDDPDGVLALARVDVAGDADFNDLEPIGRLFGETWCGRARGSVRLQGGWSDLIGFVDLVGEDIVVAQRELGDIVLRASLDSDALRVDSLTARGELGDLELTGEYRVRERVISGIDVALAARAPTAYLPAKLSAGTIDLAAHVEGPLDAPRIDFLARGAGLRWDRWTVDELEARGAHRDRRTSVERGFLRIADLRATFSGELVADEFEPPWTIDLTSLAMTRASRSLDLVAPVRIVVAPRALEIDGMRLAGTAGKLNGSCHIDDQRVNAELEVEQLDTLGLIGTYLPTGFGIDGVHGSLALQRDRGELSFAVDLSVDRLRFVEGGDEHALRVRGHQGDGRIDLQELRLARGGVDVIDVRGKAPLDPFAAQRLADGPIELAGFVAVDELDRLPWRTRWSDYSLTGDARVEFELGGTWREPRGALTWTSRELHPRVAGHDESFGPIAVDASVRLDRTIAVDELSLRGPRTTIVLKGELEHALDAVAIAAGDAPTPEDVKLKLDGTFEADDLSFLARLDPRVRRTAGRVDAQVALGGTLAKPTWAGALTLTDGAVRWSADTLRLQELDARVVFDGWRATIESFTGAIGGGPFTLSGNVDWEGEQPRIDVDLEGREILLVRTDDLRLRADAKLAFEGPWDGLKVAGELALRDGRYTRDFDLLRRLAGSRQQRSRAFGGRGIELFSIRNGPLSNAEFDVAIRGRDPFRLENNVVRATLRPELRLGGTGLYPELTGALFVEQARIDLPSGSLQLRGGTVTLPREVPLLPELDLFGDTRLMGYDITVRVSGDWDQPEIVLSSTPPLPNSDLLLLVLTGRPPTGSLAQTGEQAAQTVAVYLGQDLLSRFFKSDPWSEEEPLLERIEWQQGKEMTESGGQTMQVMVRLSSDDPDERAVYYLRGEGDVYDRVNFGFRVLFRFR